jgi:elongation factor Ts
MRKSGAIKAAKKAGNVAADGVIITKSTATTVTFWKLTARLTSLLKMVVSRHLLTKYWTQLCAGKITDVEVLKAQFEEERVALVAKIGENINIRRVAVLEGDVLGSTSTVRIGVLVAAKGADEELV